MIFIRKMLSASVLDHPLLQWSENKSLYYCIAEFFPVFKLTNLKNLGFFVLHVILQLPVDPSQPLVNVLRGRT